MNPIQYKIHAILDNRFDIDIEDYWELPEQDKEYITDIMVKEVLSLARNKRIDISFYLSELDDRRMESEYYQEYERAEIIKRIMDKTLKYHK